MLDGSVADESRRVEQRSSFLRSIRLRKAHERRRAAGELFSQSLETLPAALDEIARQQQIPRQISDKRELRGDSQIRALPLRLAGRVGDQPGVALEVTDGRIDLKECDLHCAEPPETLHCVPRLRLGRPER